MKQYPLARILDTASFASLWEIGASRELGEALKDEDSSVRYWAAIGFLSRGLPRDVNLIERMYGVMNHDKSPSVRIVAAETFARGGKNEPDTPLQTLLELAQPKGNSVYIRLAALNALDRLGNKARPGLATIKSWPTDVPKDDRAAAGISRLIHKIVKQLEQ